MLPLKEGRGVAHNFNSPPRLSISILLTHLFFAVFGYRYLDDGGTDRRKVLHDGTYASQRCLLPFWGRYH